MDILLLVVFGLNVLIGIIKIVKDGWEFLSGTIGWICAILMLVRVMIA